MNAFELKNIIPVISYDINKNIIVVSNQQLFFSLKCLKLHFNYQYVLLSCISGVDFLGKKYRFGVVYDLLSLTFNQRIRIKTFVNEITPVIVKINEFSASSIAVKGSTTPIPRTDAIKRLFTVRLFILWFEFR